MSSNPKPIRILTVDDHPLLREGIAALVNAESDMKLVAEASNGQEAIEQFRLHRPDVTLMDLQMPALNGIEAIISIWSFILMLLCVGEVHRFSAWRTLSAFLLPGVILGAIAIVIKLTLT